MMPHVTEDQFQHTVLDLAARTGWTVAHFRPARTAAGWRTPVAADGKGFPDLVLVRERVVFAELKAERGRTTAEQRLWLDLLRGAGAETHLWRPSDFDDLAATLRRDGGR